MFALSERERREYTPLGKPAGTAKVVAPEFALIGSFSLASLPTFGGMYCRRDQNLFGSAGNESHEHV